VEADIARYLELRLPASAVKVSHLSRIPGGASRETWMFKAVWTEGGARRSEEFVLRRDPPASLVESERALEYAFYRAFEGTAVPVPRMRWLENDPSHLGAPFFVMERIGNAEGSWRPLLDPAFADSRAKIARRFYEILADIHRRDWSQTAIVDVISPPDPAESWKRELDYWEGMIDRNQLSPQPITRAAIRWLRANPPPPPKRLSVVHGDYRTGNFLFRSEDVVGIVDWEMAHLGDPLEDLAWSFMEAWEWGRDGKKGGMIDKDEAIRVYEAASGEPVDRDALHWWDVFSGVKGQGIWLTGARSYQDGRTSELMMPMTAYWLTNFQDEIILRTMGRGA
jgi:aminoglycoside phosphotransferase (APT) family kinase protein